MEYIVEMTLVKCIILLNIVIVNPYTSCVWILVPMNATLGSFPSCHLSVHASLVAAVSQQYLVSQMIRFGIIVCM